MNAKALAVGLLVVVPAAVSAQTPWVPPAEGAQVGLELLKPNFRGSGVSAEVLFLSARVPFSGGFHLVGDVPMARSTEDLFTGGSESQTALGNPYLGIEWARSGVTVSFGARAPLADQNNATALVAGLLTDVDRLGAFLDEAIPVTAVVEYRLQARGFAFRGGLGPELWVNTGVGEDELVAHYLMQAWYEGPRVAVGGGFRGFTVITEDLGGVGQRTADQVGGFVRVTLGRVRPAFHVQVPLDDGLNEAIGIVYGLSLAVGFP